MIGSQPKIVHCDFDGTLVTANISEAILEAFAPSGRQAIAQDYRQGLLSVEEQNRRLFRLVTQDRETLTRFSLEIAQLRPHFKEFLDFCRQSGLDFTIVSNGFDFYIGAILEKFGLGHLPYICGRAEFTPQGMLLHYPGPEGGELAEGFKSAHLRAIKQRGFWVAYIGDGLSDFGPARLADQVFARGSLLRRCQAEGLPYHPFADFRDVIEGLKGLGL